MKRDVAGGPPKLSFFVSPAAFRTWLEQHHGQATELWVGFHKKDSGRMSITWPQSVDEALCFGWIDGIRKNVDATSYKIRFTPRKSISTWSSVNIRRVRVLTDQGLMWPAGLKAFAARRENRSGIYAYEQRSEDLPEAYARTFRKNKSAWNFFRSQPPGYRKKLMWWVVSARQEVTRLKRLESLMKASSDGGRL
ncbi:bacteriocin-protection protein [Verrucomicrobia bacterium SCGC AG-212-E04]|nr:bacteriocin-protection protein [Verrucomicrobia bacterium SCGC AG-212-E04]